MENKKIINNNKKYKESVFQNNFEMDISGKQINEFDYSVEEYFDKNKIIFLSEWSFDKKIHQYTRFNKEHFKIAPSIPTEYTFPDTNRVLNDSIERFHVKEGLPQNSFTVFISEGSTPMIAAMVLFAKKLGYDKIYSIFPLYFTIHKICDTMNIHIHPCNNDFACFENIELNLPKRKSFLFITDPIWSIGKHYSDEIFKKLSYWQKKTGSIIFVDGSFSYMNWGQSIKKEPSIILDPNLTLRLVCPTKALCLHGLRFSYLLCPKAFSKEVARISISNTGSSCYFGHLQREMVFNKMTEDNINPIGLFASKRYRELKEKFSENNIEHIVPDCGFFMFAKLDDFFKRKKKRSKYYWLNNKALDIFNSKYKGYAKINLIARDKVIHSLIKDLSK
ncbi:MAG: hypothetical protein PWQ56_421 [Patescibacteria group bacterium]|nr:hypothetical protein [Patescibacteria group bacterium]